MGNSYIQRAQSLPSNSDSQGNEREYVLNVLRETITQNVFSMIAWVHLFVRTNSPRVMQ
jgi:hypothetical protein